MIAYWHRRFRRWRRRLSRSEWIVRLFGLPHFSGDQRPGLILIQIDGLARPQLERALKSGRMPFLNRLLRDEEYRLTTFYSGQPSSTPAVQGEIFYGVRTAVPSWGFRMDGSEPVTMIRSDVAARVQESLESRSPGLLVDGSAYGDIYTGGALESHFCAASSGWGDMLKGINIAMWLFVILIHSFAALRVLALIVIELGLAVYDFFHGVLTRGELREELINVPARVGVGVILRELQTRGAMIDIARGLPVIHINYLGYDEQAHRRGPSSAFAHWSLHGIDDCIKRLWRAAQRAQDREYHLWVYSDHGQEETVPYFNENGRSVEEAVAAVFHRKWEQERHQRRDIGVQLQRAHWLGGKRLQRLFRQTPPAVAEDELVVAKGPTGHIYAPEKLSAAEESRLAKALVRDANIPIVLARDGPRRAKAWTAEGVFRLPEQAALVLGEDHPFLEEVTRDLIETVHHPWAGSFTISGWRPHAKPVTFPVENGSHAGPGRQETQGFALLPRHVDIAEAPKGYIRPLELRGAAMRTRGFGAHCHVDFAGGARRNGDKRSIRIMTYNVHSGIGVDGQLSLERLSRVIRQYDPDVVALQELDVHRVRSGGIDQAHALARSLGMDVHFHPNFRVAEEQFGDAILSRFPMRLVKAAALPTPPALEPRGAIWVEIDLDGIPIQIINTHFGLGRNERSAQATALLGRDWLEAPECRPPVILCGDFNSLPRSLVYRLFTRRLRDACRHVPTSNGPMRGSYMGLWHVDYVFASEHFEIQSATIPRTSLVRMASDHLPVVADLRLAEPPSQSPS